MREIRSVVAILAASALIGYINLALGILFLVLALVRAFIFFFDNRERAEWDRINQHSSMVNKNP